MSAKEIVKCNYRAARVLLRYQIPYCCGARFSLRDVCESRGIEPEKILAEIARETREVRLAGDPGYEEWSTTFLIDYVINVHHRYLKKVLPELEIQVKAFVEEHEKGQPDLKPVARQFSQLAGDLLELITTEEEFVFPYIRQLSHAHQNRDSYGKLLVKTLRKPVTMLMDQQLRIDFLLEDLRLRTNQFTPPEKACVSHQVNFARLKELNDDISQHSYLEKDLLYPRLDRIEMELGQTGPE